MFFKLMKKWEKIVVYEFKIKVNVPVCDPVSVCGHFFIFSSIDEANDKKR